VDTYGGEMGGSQNTFLQFIVQGLRVLKEGGIISYITPDTLMVNERYESLRRNLITEATLASVVRATFAVFGQVVRSCIFVAVAKQADDYVCSLCFAEAPDEFARNRFSEEFQLHPMELLTNPYCRFLPKPRVAPNVSTVPLGDICQVKDGINPGMSSLGVRTHLFLDHEAGRNPKKLLEGKNISRYRIEWSGAWVDYDKGLISPEARRGGASLRNETIFVQPKKLVSRQTADRLIFALDDQQMYTTNSTHNTFLVSSGAYALEYVLGILSSKLMSYLYRGLTGEVGDVFPQVHISMLKKLPVRRIDFSNTEEKRAHDTVVALVERMLRLRQKMSEEPSSRGELQDAESSIAITDGEIDRLVYDLYGLTGEERRLVEEASSR